MTVGVLAVLTALSRLLAVSRSLWEWDEALFMSGMRGYDVAMHHPHPPGFPIYIALGKVARLLVHDDFRALQGVNLVAAMLAFPAMFLLARALRLRFEVSIVAASLFAFFPNVWFFGGTAFSDIPSIVLVVFAAAFLFRGAERRGDYWLGTFLLALAIGIRPQNLIVGLYPGLVATRRRRPHEIVAALLIGVAVCAAAYGGAIYATGSAERYFGAVRAHAEYISTIDSWRSAARPPLWRLFDRFFIKQYQSPVLSILTSLLVIVSAVGAIRERSRPIRDAVLVFGPFAILAWLTLDRFSINRFSIGYAPLFAILAADGIARTARALQPRLAARIAPARVTYAIGGALVLAFAVYTARALPAVRNTESPSVLAVRAATTHVHAPTEKLFVGYTMSPFMDLLAPQFPYVRVLDDRGIPLSEGRSGWLLAEINRTGRDGYVFSRPHDALWHIARRHYFDIKLAPMTNRAIFGAGWYGAESGGHDEWRWTSGHAVTILPPLRVTTAMLRIHFDAPPELVAQRGTVIIALNGKVLDRITPGVATVERDYRVSPAAGGATNRLDIVVSRTVNPGALDPHNDDRRDLGVKVRFLAWGRK